MDSMNSLIDILICFSGLYVLYSYFLMRFKKELKEGILISKNTPIKKCKDKEGYMREIQPKVLIFGLATTLCGVLGMAESRYHFLGMYYLAVIGVFLAVTAWFAFVQKKLTEKYWPTEVHSNKKKRT